MDFAEVGDFLDTPFRHFSSGMKVRLGFSVVTTLDEPVVLVDEVLAVGDRAFREKCYGRMSDLLSGGRTLFLVSHNETDLRRFCTRGLYLKGGSLVVDGPLEDALDRYRADIDRRRKKRRPRRDRVPRVTLAAASGPRRPPRAWLRAAAAHADDLQVHHGRRWRSSPVTRVRRPAPWCPGRRPRPASGRPLTGDGQVQYAAAAGRGLRRRRPRTR